MSRNTEAYQSFQLDIGPGAYKRAFLTHRNAVTTAVKRVAGAPCVTEDEKKKILRADLERNVNHRGCWNRRVGARPATPWHAGESPRRQRS